MRFADVNGDGLVDMLRNLHVYNVHTQSPYYAGQSTAGAWLNTGDGWEPAPQYTPPVALWARGVDLNDNNGARLVDVNGDGLVDMVRYLYHAGQSHTGAWLNTGNGWDYAAEYIPNAVLWSRDGNERDNNGAQFVDINGDGLPDQLMHVYSGGASHAKAWLNTGAGWVSAPRFAPPVRLWTRADKDNEGVQFVDVNGDGLPDMVQHLNSSGQTHTGAWLNTGGGWESAPQYAPPAALWARGGNRNDNNGTQVADINGDGAVDLLHSLRADGATHTQTWLAAPRHSLLTRVLRGENAAATHARIDYAPLTDADVYTKDSGARFPVMDIQSPRYVVREVALANGVGGYTRARYHYRGLKADRRGMIGFARISKTYPATNKVTETHYNQSGFPLNGRIERLIERHGTQIVKETHFTYGSEASSAGVFKLFLEQSTENRYQLNGERIHTRVTRNSHIDAFGNIGRVTVSTSGGGQTFTQTTRNHYHNDGDNWFLGQLTKTTVTHTAPGRADVFRGSRFSYDDQTGLISHGVDCTGRQRGPGINRGCGQVNHHHLYLRHLWSGNRRHRQCRWLSPAHHHHGL